MTPKILLVEDDKIIQRIVKTYFEKFDCEVDVASTGSDGILMGMRNLYHLILMDIGLPDIDGFEVTTSIKQNSVQNHSTPVVALTAHDDERYRRKGRDVNMVDYIVKPLTMAQCYSLLYELHLLKGVDVAEA